MSSESLRSARGRRTYTARFKAEMVAQCLRGDVSLASLAVDHGMNPNVLHRWVMEHERYGKHELQDDGGGAVFTPTRDISPANWIPLNRVSGTDRQALTPALAKIIEGTDSDPQPRNTIEVELVTRELTLTVRWPGGDPQGLAIWTRAVLV